MTDKPDTSTEAVERLAKFQDNATIYFVNRPTGGEDRAHWSNVANSETCEKTANTLRKLAAERDALRAEVAALQQAVERARGEALEEAAALIETHVYSQGASGPYLRHAADARLDTHHATIAAAIRARAGGAGDE